MTRERRVSSQLGDRRKEIEVMRKGEGRNRAVIWDPDVHAVFATEKGGTATQEWGEWVKTSPANVL